MKVLDLIDKYYPQDNELKHILNVHSRSVADKALWIAVKHPELNLDTVFLEEAAMLHDIGIFLTHAPGIQCFGTEPTFVMDISEPDLSVRKVSPDTH